MSSPYTTAQLRAIDEAFRISAELAEHAEKHRFIRCDDCTAPAGEACCDYWNHPQRNQLVRVAADRRESRFDDAAMVSAFGGLAA